MKEKREDLRKIGIDLKAYIKKHCGENPDQYDDFVGESCDLAFHMLWDTVLRMEEEEKKRK